MLPFMYILCVQPQFWTGFDHRWFCVYSCWFLFVFTSFHCVLSYVLLSVIESWYILPISSSLIVIDCTISGFVGFSRLLCYRSIHSMRHFDISLNCHEHVTEWVILKCMHNIWILPDVKQYTSSMNRKPIALTITEMLGSTQGHRKTQQGSKQKSTLNQNLRTNTITDHLYANDKMNFNMVVISSERHCGKIGCCDSLKSFT